jgi:hypothetical protein
MNLPMAVKKAAIIFITVATPGSDWSCQDRTFLCHR